VGLGATDHVAYRAGAHPKSPAGLRRRRLSEEDRADRSYVPLQGKPFFLLPIDFGVFACDALRSGAVRKKYWKIFGASSSLHSRVFEPIHRSHNRVRTIRAQFRSPRVMIPNPSRPTHCSQPRTGDSPTGPLAIMSTLFASITKWSAISRRQPHQTYSLEPTRVVRTISDGFRGCSRKNHTLLNFTMRNPPVEDAHRRDPRVVRAIRAARFAKRSRRHRPTPRRPRPRARSVRDGRTRHRAWPRVARAQSLRNSAANKKAAASFFPNELPARRPEPRDHTSTVGEITRGNCTYSQMRFQTRRRSAVAFESLRSSADKV
jgi:hypothetical protein